MSHLVDRFRSCGAFQTGEFTLASGKKSSYYIDCKKAIFQSHLVFTLANALLEELHVLEDPDVEIDSIGGLEVGAIPLVAAVLARDPARNLRGFFVRKQPKDHGSKSLIEGNLEPGDNVVILEDVLTTGGSALQAIKAVEEFGAKVVGVVGLVDRLEGAREALAGYEVRSLLTIRDFGVEQQQELLVAIGGQALADYGGGTVEP